MDGERAQWDEPTCKLFLQLCIEEKEKLNFAKGALTKEGWRNVYQKFKESSTRRYTPKQLQNKFTNFKRNFMQWKNLQNQTGLGRDRTTGGVTADADWWSNNEEAAPSCGKPPSFEEELTLLFSGHGQDRGKMLCAGGVDTNTPSGGSEEEEAARMASDMIGRCSAARSSKRASTDVSVDSPPKKKTSSSIEEHIAMISEAMHARCSRDVAPSREQTEMMEVLDVLEQDGVEQGTELHFIAMELLRNPIRRTCFKKLKSADIRKSWLEWTWKVSKK